MKKDDGAPRRNLRVGDRVRFLWGKDVVEGVIVEDRGHIGAGGRQLWRIEFQLEPSYTLTTEFPEELLLAEA